MLLGPSAALILNATKHLAGIDHSVKLIPQEMIEPIQKTKTEYLGGHNPRLHTDEVLGGSLRSLPGRRTLPACP